jgi:hypothetical protein
MTIFWKTNYNDDRSIWDVAQDNRNAIVTTLALTVPPIAVWSLLSPWAAGPLTLGALIASPGLLLTKEKWLGGLMGGLVYLGVAAGSSLEHEKSDPSIIPSVIPATMDEVCWKKNSKILLRVPTPHTQEMELRASGLGLNVGPSYAQHLEPDVSVQWYQPYIPGTVSRNPFYTAEISAYTKGTPATVEGTKPYIVTIEDVQNMGQRGLVAKYTVEYSYNGYWFGNPIPVKKQFVTDLRPNVLACQ